MTYANHLLAQEKTRKGEGKGGKEPKKQPGGDRGGKSSERAQKMHPK